MKPTFERKQLLQVYPDLLNIQDIQEKFFFVSQDFVGSLINVSPMFGSLFLCYIDYLVQTIDIGAIDYIKQIISSDLNLNQKEQQSLSNICNKLSEIVKRLIDLEQEVFQEEENIKHDDKQLEFLLQIEQMFISQGNTFIEGFELAASIYIMKQITQKYNQRNDQERIHNIIFSSANLTDSTQIYQSQIDELCKIFNINCSIYQQSENQLILIGNSNYQQECIQYPSDYHFIFNEGQNKIRFGYNITSIRKQQLFSDKLFQYNEYSQILKGTLEELKQANKNPMIIELQKTIDKTLIKDYAKMAKDLQDQITQHNDLIRERKEESIERTAQIKSLKIQYDIQ